jgi:hypothetical protein
MIFLKLFLLVFTVALFIASFVHSYLGEHTTSSHHASGASPPPMKPKQTWGPALRVGSDTQNVFTTTTTTTSSTTTSVNVPVDVTNNFTSGVAISLMSEFNIYSARTSVDTLIGVNLQASAPPSVENRAPVDCVLILDMSGSMSPKFSLLIETVTLLLDEFGVNDRVGIVTFGSNVYEPLSLQYMSQEGRLKAEKVVKALKISGNTNLSGGTFKGVEQLTNSFHQDDGRIRTVILMSDGQANSGLTKLFQIEPILSNMIKDKAISIHTFGYGMDHDAVMLRGISAVGSGSYYFVEVLPPLFTICCCCCCWNYFC